MTAGPPIRLGDLRRSFHGAVPAAIATASADGIPNITYLSSVHLVDDERLALSNQFFSKTSRNLSENHRASLLVVDPLTYDEHRLEVVFERTERRGPVFENLRDELDAVAAMSEMEDLFELRTADIYRVVSIEPVLGAAARRGDQGPEVPPVLDAPTAAALTESMSIGRFMCSGRPLHQTSRTRYPIAGARVRRTVSTSGSSGTFCLGQAPRQLGELRDG
mgnify:CR=1 FL=1